MWKTKVRYFLAWSSISPCLAMYRWLYWFAIWIAELSFRPCRGVVALYLSRGGARNQITPGVSDIDFVLIVGPDAAERRRAERVFRRLDKISAGLIPYHPSFVLNEQELHLLWRTTPVRRYLFEEGRSGWRLLFGRDVRPGLPAMSDLERTSSCFSEMHYWWMQFADFLLQNENCRHDLILRRSLCGKAVPEMLNALRALRTGEFCYSRAEALRREDSPLCRRLRAAAAPRLPRPDPELEEEVYRFLVGVFLDLWDSFAEAPFLAVFPGVTQTVEPAIEDIEAEKAQPPFLDICRHLHEVWGSKCLGVHLLKSAFYPLDCRLLIVDAERGNLPRLAELEALLAVREKVYRGRRAPYFVLRVGQVGFPLTPAIPRDFHRGVLTPATAPDVFLQLGEGPAYWTSHTQWYLGEWESNRQWLEATEGKRRQLGAITQSIAEGHVRYSLGATEISL
ncbi:MAG TPA: hypothetical protein VMJ34_06880 [Bryobacteraceae bacterium]|nr:hypothetical protein [Bryobacteraceae bacterium]